MIIIGLSGKMGSGKNYIAEKIIYPSYKDEFNILIIGFGDLLKNELFARDTSLSYDELYDHKTFETRNKLQQYGTENGRDKYHQDIWVRGLDIQVETFRRRSNDNCLIIVCDVRFQNEAEYIINKGGKLIRVISEDRTNERYLKEAKGDKEQYQRIASHRSETELDSYRFNFVINNSKDTCNFEADIYNILDEIDNNIQLEQISIPSQV
jgi:dephospho-CoA kinase